MRLNRERISKIWKQFRNYIREPIHALGLVAIPLAILLAIFGYINQHATTELNGELVEIYIDSPFLGDFYANIAAEFASIAITILILDYLSGKRQTVELKKQLIRQLSSKHGEVAATALNELKYYGWLYDGSLIKASLQSANLANTVFGEVNLQEAHLFAADLSGANFMGANLKGAVLYVANLEKSLLSNADLSEGNHIGADFSYASLEKVNFSRSSMRSAKFIKAKLYRATFFEASLVNADLTEADLTYADLSESDLEGANLSKADLRAANLNGANLEKTNLTIEQLKCTKTYEGAKIPQHIIKQLNAEKPETGELRRREQDEKLNNFNGMTTDSKLSQITNLGYKDAIREVKKIKNVILLERLLDAEIDKKNRKTVISAITRQLKTLKS